MGQESKERRTVTSYAMPTWWWQMLTEITNARTVHGIETPWPNKQAFFDHVVQNAFPELEAEHNRVMTLVAEAKQRGTR